MSDKITPNFSLEEFLCAGVSIYEDTHTPPTIDAGRLYEEETQNIYYLANRLQVVRDVRGFPFYPTSGFRTWQHHADIYKRYKLGTPPKNSYHLKGMAADEKLPPVIRDRLWAFWDHAWSGGLGIYNWGLHWDIGPRRRWDKRNKTLKV